MISLLQGKVLSNNGTEGVIMTAGGVGYRVVFSPNAAKLYTINSEVMVEAYLVVREDALDLYGFANIAEKELFKSFISVSGIGPRTAMHLLELGSVEEITLAIGRGDIAYLTKVSGIGQKTAERLVVELKSKVQSLKSKIGGLALVNSDILGDVIDALISLGYSALQAREAVKSLNAKGKTSEQLLREALKAVK